MEDDIEYEFGGNYTVSVQDWSSDLSHSWPQGGVSVSLGPIQHVDPPPQQDLFRHYIQSQWVHLSHLADEDPQWQCEAWIKTKPHLSELQQQGCLEISQDKSEDDYDYYFVGDQKDFLIWKLRWSEYLDQ